MKEFMFFINNASDARKALAADDHLAFVKKCKTYISRLKAEGKLAAAQPLIREGIILSKTRTGWNKKQAGLAGDVHVGYYHILAKDLDEAGNCKG